MFSLFFSYCVIIFWSEFRLLYRSLLRCYFVLLGSTLAFYSLPTIPLLIFHIRRENLYG